MTALREDACAHRTRSDRWRSHHCVCLPASAQQLTPFRVGISDAVNTVLPVWMAEEGGFYAANGLKVEIINMGGGSRGAKELQAGKIDLMRVGMSSVVQANRVGRRPAADRLDEQRDPLRDRDRAGREDRGRPQGRRHRRVAASARRAIPPSRWRWSASA